MGHLWAMAARERQGTQEGEGRAGTLGHGFPRPGPRKFSSHLPWFLMSTVQSTGRRLFSSSPSLQAQAPLAW